MRIRLTFNRTTLELKYVQIKLVYLNILNLG
jgi:hypothetical protein